MHNTYVSVLTILLLISVLTVFSVPVAAQSKTIIVPDDYSSITSAIGNASNGDVILIRKGTYEEPINQTIVIDKSLSIIGEDPKNTNLILHPVYTETWILTSCITAYTDSITVRANDFLLSNLTINSIRAGNISITGNRARIFGNSIFTGSTANGLAINGDNCQVTDNTLFGTIFLTGSHNIISNNVCHVIFLNSANYNAIVINSLKFLSLGLNNQSLCSSNHIIGNRIDGYEGVLLGCAIGNIFSKNLFNCQIGYFVYQLGPEIGSSANLTPSENNSFYLNNFIGYLVGRTFALTSTKNFWDNGVEGNYYNDYNGSDVNQDGIGDVPYIINDNNTDNYPLVAPCNIDDISAEFEKLKNIGFNFQSAPIVAFPLMITATPSPPPSIVPIAVPTDSTLNPSSLPILQPTINIGPHTGPALIPTVLIVASIFTAVVIASILIYKRHRNTAISVKKR